MKKTKRSFDLEEEQMDYSKDMGIDLDSDLDDEILDLEDIVEMPPASEEEGPGREVELLDVDSDLDLSDLNGKLNRSGAPDILDEDLLKGFSFDETEEKTAEPGIGNGDIFDQSAVDDLLKGFSFDTEPASPEPELPELAPARGVPGKPPLGDFGPGSSVDREPDLFPSQVEETRTKAALESLSVAPAALETAMGGVAPTVTEAPVGGASLAALDDVVSRIEDRLLEAVREIVHSRLPDIVRTVLREEIEKLKREF